MGWPESDSESIEVGQTTKVFPHFHRIYNIQKWTRLVQCKVNSMFKEKWITLLLSSQTVLKSLLLCCKSSNSESSLRTAVSSVQSGSSFGSHYLWCQAVSLTREVLSGQGSFMVHWKTYEVLKFPFMIGHWFKLRTTPVAIRNLEKINYITS